MDLEKANDGEERVDTRGLLTIYGVEDYLLINLIKSFNDEFSSIFFITNERERGGGDKQERI